MSVDFSIACKDCKKHLWIAQSPDNLYLAEPDVMEALRTFLFDHVGHNLVFCSPERDDNMLGTDWKEIESIKIANLNKMPPEELKSIETIKWPVYFWLGVIAIGLLVLVLIVK